MPEAKGNLALPVIDRKPRDTVRSGTPGQAVTAR